MSIGRIPRFFLSFLKMFRHEAKPNWMFGGAHRGDRWGMDAMKGLVYEKVQRWDPMSIAKWRNI